MKILTILGGFTLAGLASAAMAQAPGQGQAQRRAADVTRAELIQRTDAAFARLDTDNDGRFTREEARARVEQRREERRSRLFQRLDANHDGQISREEFTARPAPRAGERRRGFGRPGMRGHRMGRGAGMFGEDGAVTRAQFRARALERFDRADTDRDGTLTVAERRAQRGQHRRSRMAPPQAGPAR